MRRSPKFVTLALALLTGASLMALGCASHKQVSTEAPPPPATTETQTPPPPPEATEKEPPPAETSTRASLEDAFFDYDEAALRADAKTALEGDAKYMEANSGSKVVIEGHCDERGSVEYNLALGERRAKAAKDFLVSYGIPEARMTTISYGKERPFDPGHDESAWAKNRRAHVVAK